MCSFLILAYFFFFKQKTAYEMRISDWSSDVCSSDLAELRRRGPLLESERQLRARPPRARAGRGDRARARAMGPFAEGFAGIKARPPREGGGRMWFCATATCQADGGCKMGSAARRGMWSKYVEILVVALIGHKNIRT